MSLALEQFQELRNKFNEEQAKTEGNQVMIKVIKIINELGSRFIELDGSELSEMQTKLAGYKFYLADQTAELNREAKEIALFIKELRAQRWDEITEEIKAIDGKVKNKEQIENKLMIESKPYMHRMILLETLYEKNKLRIRSIEDILTACVQQIATKKREIEQSKQ